MNTQTVETVTGKSKADATDTNPVTAGRQCVSLLWQSRSGLQARPVGCVALFYKAVLEMRTLSKCPTIHPRVCPHTQV